MNQLDLCQFVSKNRLFSGILTDLEQEKAKNTVFLT